MKHTRTYSRQKLRNSYMIGRLVGFTAAVRDMGLTSTTVSSLRRNQNVLDDTARAQNDIWRLEIAPMLCGSVVVESQQTVRGISCNRKKIMPRKRYQVLDTATVGHLTIILSLYDNAFITVSLNNSNF